MLSHCCHYYYFFASNKPLKLKIELINYYHCFIHQTSPVWEITGAEFSKSESHTADGISIRFPRMTKIRKDKSWKEATDLQRLKVCAAKKATFPVSFCI